MKKISNYLNENNIPTKKNKKWASQTISTILKNPLYCGYLHWEDYLNPSEHEPIIDKTIFNNVQKIIKKRNIRRNQETKKYTLLE